MLNKIRNTKIDDWAFVLYAFGVFADWTYWIASGWPWASTNESSIHSLPIIFGWIPALVWPLHVGAEIWWWVL